LANPSKAKGCYAQFFFFCFFFVFVFVDELFFPGKMSKRNAEMSNNHSKKPRVSLERNDDLLSVEKCEKVCRELEGVLHSGETNQPNADVPFEILKGVAELTANIEKAKSVQSDSLSVCLLGEPGVGKSTFLNEVVGLKVVPAHVNARSLTKFPIKIRSDGSSSKFILRATILNSKEKELLQKLQENG
jgi:ribosome biogenesis GTPase A